MSDESPTPGPITPPITAGPVTKAGKDRDHMRILAIFYFISGGLTLLGTLCSSFYLVFGIMFLVGGEGMFASDPNPPPPEVAAFIGWVFIAISIFAMAIGGTIGGLQLYTGTSLLKCRRYTLCLVVAAITCLSVPLGTILGVFTFVVITRPSAKALFEANA